MFVKSHDTAEDADIQERDLNNYLVPELEQFKLLDGMEYMGTINHNTQDEKEYEEIAQFMRLYDIFEPN